MKFKFFERFSGRVGSNRGRPDSGGRAAGGAARGGRSPTRARRHATAGGHPHTTLVRTLERVGALVHNADARRRGLAFALAVVCVGMLVAPVAVASAGASPGEGVGAGADERSPAPAGMVGVPADNVGPPEHAPDHAGPPAEAGIPTHAAAWDVHSDRHAGDLEVTIAASADGELEIRLTDEVNHDGRTVAISADALEETVGHRPAIAHGQHSSGDEWTSEIQYRGSHALFDVEKFSTNTVTFSGEIVLEGNEAGDGSTYTYEMDDSESVDQVDAELTGALSEEWAYQSETFTDGDGSTLQVDGTTDPDTAEVTLTGQETSTDVAKSGSVNPPETVSVDVGGNLEPTGGTLEVDGSSSSLGSSTESHDFSTDGQIGSWSGFDGGTATTIKIWTASQTDSSSTGVFAVYIDGTYVGDHTIDRSENDPHTFSTDTEISSTSTVEYEADTDTLADAMTFEEVEVMEQSNSGISVDVNGQSHSFGVSGSESINLATGSNSLEFTADNDATVDWDVSFTENRVTEDPSVTIGTETVSHSGVLNGGETVTEPISPGLGENSISVSTTDGSTVQADIDVLEVSQSVDPAIDVNGHTVGYDGVLAAGETATLDVNSDWVVDGENRVTINTGDTNGGPESLVGFDYRHDADSVQKSVEVAATTWSESYNISQTFANEKSNAEATIPFVSDRVVSIRGLEVRHDESGEWSTPNYDLDGTELTVELGDVDAGETIEVRAVGSKVRVNGGEIDVLEPTVEGNKLDTLIEITDHSEEFAISVGGTAESNWLHYLTDESWTGAEPTTVVVGADGSQEIRVPDASAGSNARATTMPLEVEPDTGEVEIDVLDSEDPRLGVAPSSSVSEVDYTWHDTVSGDRYILYSITHDIARDSGFASSPVTLTGPGYEEVLTILTDSDDDGETAGSGGGSGAVGTATSVALANPLLVLAVGVALVSGFAYTASRTEIPMRSTVGVAALVALFGLEAIAPGSISSGVHSTIVMVGSELGEVAPAVVLIAVGVGAYVVVTYWRARRDEASTPDTQVSLRLGGDDE